MYLVVSTWEALPGREAEFDRIGTTVASILRQQPGVLVVEAIKNGNQHVAVHGYHDQATYEAVVNDPNGAFAKAAAEYRIEENARWIGSVRGETMAH